MKWMQEQKRHENLTYLALWSILFAVPVLSLYMRSVNSPVFDFEWREVITLLNGERSTMSLLLLNKWGNPIGNDIIVRTTSRNTDAIDHL